MGRDHVTTAELAFDADKRITRACGSHVTSNMGAYYYFYAPYIPTGAALKVLPGVYDIPVLSYWSTACSPTPCRSTPTAAPAGRSRSTASSG